MLQAIFLSCETHYPPIHLTVASAPTTQHEAQNKPAPESCDSPPSLSSNAISGNYKPNWKSYTNGPWQCN